MLPPRLHLGTGCCWAASWIAPHSWLRAFYSYQQTFLSVMALAFVLSITVPVLSMPSDQEVISSDHGDLLDQGRFQVQTQRHSNQAHSNQAHSNQAHSNQAHSNQVRSNQVGSNQVHSNQVHTNTYIRTKDIRTYQMRTK